MPTRCCFATPLWSTLLTVLTLLTGLVAPTAAQEKGATRERKISRRTLADIATIAESSRVQYEVKTVAADSENGKAILERFDQPPGEVAQFPRLERRKNGNVSIEEWRCLGEARVVLAEAEQAFSASDYVTARQAYLRTVGLDPECYMAHAHIGDTFFREDNPAASIGPYSRAIELNPLDHRSYTYRGHAYLRLGQGDKALSDFQTALVLRPHYWLVVNLIEHYKEFPVTLNDLRFVPPLALERTRGQGGQPDRVSATLVVDPNSPDWTARLVPYALCRAVWLGEGFNLEPEAQERASQPPLDGSVAEEEATATKSPRGSDSEPSERRRKKARKKQKKTQQSDGLEVRAAAPASPSAPAEEPVPDSGSFFDAREEAECLLATLDGIEAGDDVELDALKQAVEAGYLEEAVIYGIGAQRFGQLPLMLDESARDRLGEYVGRFVLTAAEKSLSEVPE